MNNDIKQLLAAIALEQYVAEGTFQQCLPADGKITLEQAKAQADEIWSVAKEQLEVISFDYEGYTVNLTFQRDGLYLFDSVDIWAEEGDGTKKGSSQLGTLATIEGWQHFADNEGMQMECFDIGDERVYLLPSAVTLHYLNGESKWKLVKIAGAYRSVEQVRDSLQNIANASI
ncbi:hypothetical protein [Paenibacillus silvae]|uniref:hypothetical protein n=1 Tax=Paenibacillus silvae TaxID=1325358 RepID=UPI002006C78D|nr:hypothetical protein [Paenibacillus silvae]MCK6078566.1 hypothetical protein [Paenibacillus silvae]MCK6152885.1 hypothetical protein [Paenibacillus silvae]MCK6271338.1 hypothetical protein [Paenibacillus silvae]